MELRPATVADVEIILRHRSEMFREMGGEYERSRSSFEGASRQYFESALRDGSYYGLVAEIEGNAVGGGGVLIAAWPGSPLNVDARRAWILNIYVDPDRRGQGLGRLITEALIAWCGENGFQSVALHASEFGRPLYEKLGFRGTNEMRLRL
jgi:GNAT superfamily N-acetyltransferase